MARPIRRPNYKPYNVGEYRLGWLRGGFCAVLRVSGKRHRFQLHAATEMEARTALHAFAQEQANNTLDPNPTIARLFELYVIDREAEGVQVQKLRYKWTVLAPTFGHMRPRT